MSIVYSQLPTPNSQFPTPNFQFPSPNPQLGELTAEDVAYAFRSLIDPVFIGRTSAYRNLGAVDICRVHYRNPAVASLIERASAALDAAARGELYGRIEQTVAEDVPYSPLRYKTNVAVFQPDIHGVRRSAIADFTFLKNVYRTRAQ